MRFLCVFAYNESEGSKFRYMSTLLPSGDNKKSPLGVSSQSCVSMSKIIVSYVTLLAAHDIKS